jgi:DNA-binding IclR family transcriptional regulator
MRNGQVGARRNGDRPAVQSVGRAIAILELLADEPGELGVTELGRRLGVHKATASRLVSTLSERGLVERNGATDKFRLGFGVIHLAGSAIARLDFVRQARPVLEALAERTGETVNLAVLDGEGVMHVDQITGNRSVVSVSWVGRRTPFHCTSNGKVLAAFADPERLDELLAGPMPRLTRRTIVDPGELRSHLVDVRARGYATAVEELEEGLTAVAAPVRRADGQVMAAVSVSGPAFRMRASELPKIAGLAVEAGADISRRLGYRERSRSSGG